VQAQTRTHTKESSMSAGDQAMISVQCCVRIHYQAEVQKHCCLMTKVTFQFKAS